MKLSLAYYGDPILRMKTKLIDKIDESIHQLVAGMVETMEAHDGIGLAAPQVHQSLSLFITCIPIERDDEDLPGVLKIFTNPKIIAYSQETWSCEEACLSIPGLEGTISRPEKVTIQATDLEGRLFTEEFTQFEAHVIMHENDHLNGVLFIDRLAQKQRRAIELKLRRIKYSS
jgi:peptide deformylase